MRKAKIPWWTILGIALMWITFTTLIFIKNLGRVMPSYTVDLQMTSIYLMMMLVPTALGFLAGCLLMVEED
jgi:hypothetical protein